MDFLNSLRRRLQPSPSETTRVQVLSDLHLELGQIKDGQQYFSFSFPANAPILLLAGDIGRLVDYDAYLAFLAAQTSRFATVLLVLGNHEFYDLDYDAGLAEARRLVAEPRLDGRVVLLDKTRWDDPDSGVSVLGCTLWSAIPEDARTVVKLRISDYRQIKSWSPERHDEVHVQEASWLREQVARFNGEAGGRRLLVATHHAPCVEGTSAKEHQGNPWGCAFATDLLAEGGWRGVDTWVFGHTHYTTTFKTKGVRVVANQRGYVFPGARTGRRRKGMRGGSSRFMSSTRRGRSISEGTSA